MTSAAAALERLCDPAHEVSAHYLIGRDGRCWHLVQETMRAWHAGAGAWGAVRDVNSRSIGIEIDNDGLSPYSEPAMATLERLLHAVMSRWAIAPARVIGHSDMAPGRKQDPGARFDWRRLSRGGLAAPTPQVACDPTEVGVSALDALLRTIGYTADAPADARCTAFRLRHRPSARGPACGTDMALARAIAVDQGPADA